MGLDGGTYVTRSDVLRRQSWQVAQADTSRSTRGGAVSTTPAEADPRRQRETSVAAWTTCTLSGQALQEPLVADYLGALYNKSAVLELLLCRKEVWVEGQASLYRHLNREQQAHDLFAHIKSLKDVFPVQLGRSSTSSQPASSSGGEVVASGFVCPVTGLPLGCSVKAVALVQCGHVVAERALEAVGGRECPVCGEGGDREWHVVPVNAAAEEVDALRRKLDMRRQRRKRAVKQGRDDDERCSKKPLTAAEALVGTQAGAADAGGGGAAAAGGGMALVLQ